MRLYRNVPEVVFADVNLSRLKRERPRGLRGHHGDWPCIRYYNGETGVEGEDYVRQKTHREDGTELRLCEEIGPRQYYLLKFVSRVARPLCDVGDRSECDDVSLRFLKTAEKDDDGTLNVVEKWTTLRDYYKSQLESNPGNWEAWRRMDMLEKLIELREKIEEEEL